MAEKIPKTKPNFTLPENQLDPETLKQIVEKATLKGLKAEEKIDRNNTKPS